MSIMADYRRWLCVWVDFWLKILDQGIKLPTFSNPLDFYLPSWEKNCTPLSFSRFGKLFLEGLLMSVYFVKRMTPWVL